MVFPAIALLAVAAGCVASREPSDSAQAKEDTLSPDAGSLPQDVIRDPSDAVGLPHDGYTDIKIPEGTDVKGDAKSCPNGPQKFVGDGTYKVAIGDSIQADNGVQLQVTDHWKYGLAADFYIGTEKLNHAPYEMPGAGWCSKAFGTQVSGGGLFDKKDDCGRIPLVLMSLFKGPIDSRMALYKACVTAGNTHGLCSDYIPSSAALGEAHHKDGKFSVFVQGAANSDLGPYLLKQLKQCYGPVHNYFGLSEVLPDISLRWYYDKGSYTQTAYCSDYQIHWPWVFDASEVDEVFKSGAWDINDLECTERTVVHELSHLLRKGIYKPYYVEEGLAMLAEETLTAKELMATPDFNDDATIGTEWTLFDDNGPLKIKITAIDPAGQKMGISVLYSNAGAAVDYEMNPKTVITLHNSGKVMDNIAIVAVGSIQLKTAHVRAYSNYAKKLFPWHLMTLCESDGYYDNSAYIKIDGQFYSHHYNKQYASKTAFDSLSEPKVGYIAYHTGFCFWKGLMDLCGGAIVKDFLMAGDKVRQKNLQGIPETFCWSKSLSEACGGVNLGSYFAKFDLPYSATNCAAISGNGGVFDSMSGIWICK